MAQTLGSLRLPALCAATLLLGGCPVPGPYQPASSTTSPTPTPGGARATAPRSPAASGSAAMPGTPSPGAPTPAAGASGSAAGLEAPRPPREIRLSAATRSLVTQAHVQTAQGEVDAASATLDRALRIEPSNALLWIELGRLRLVENDARQAESCGRKALALASGDAGAQTQARQLLDDALRASAAVSPTGRR